MTRHTYASHFLVNVPDLPYLAQILGHSSIRITELYSHMLPGRLNRAKNAVSIGLDFLEKTLDLTLDQKVA
jgi:site-specific recombinase XerD